MTDYSAFPGASCPGQSPTRRIIVRIDDEYFGALTIRFSMVLLTMSLPKRNVRMVLLPLHCMANAKPFGSDLVSLSQAVCSGSKQSVRSPDLDAEEIFRG